MVEEGWTLDEGRRNLKTLNNLLAAVTLGILLAAPGAQTQQRVATKEQTVPSFHLSGRVFLITQAGDLKPARMVTVNFVSPDIYILQMEWSIKLSKQRIETMERTGETGPGDSCHNDLQIERAALGYALALHDQEGSVHYDAATDEEGNFSFDVKKAAEGDWAVFATGRAGFKEAFWVQAVEVKPGKPTMYLKLAKPKNVCIDVEKGGR
jgi:hypothetical protein